MTWCPEGLCILRGFALLTCIEVRGAEGAMSFGVFLACGSHPAFSLASCGGLEMSQPRWPQGPD